MESKWEGRGLRKSSSIKLYNLELGVKMPLKPDLERYSSTFAFCKPNEQQLYRINLLLSWPCSWLMLLTFWRTYYRLNLIPQCISFFVNLYLPVLHDLYFPLLRSTFSLCKYLLLIKKLYRLMYLSTYWYFLYFVTLK